MSVASLIILIHRRIKELHPRTALNIVIFIFYEIKKERETGIEPATPTLARWCSTAEPLAHCVV